MGARANVDLGNLAEARAELDQIPSLRVFEHRARTIRAILRVKDASTATHC